MPAMFQFTYRFHPAGQGIFASGTVADVESSVPFHWVFDCGSVSTAHVMRVAQSYRNIVIEDSLDLLCISHFDHDHVSGLAALLSGLHVGTVVLPYYSKLETLILGSRYTRPAPEYLQFLGNPIAYILERAASVRTIIIVGSPPDDGPPFPNLPARPPNIEGPRNSESPKRLWTFNPEKLSASAEPPILDTATLHAAAECGTLLCNESSSFMGYGCPITSSARWEFLFFHKPLEHAGVPFIHRRVASQLAAIRRKTPKADLTTILSDPESRKKIRAAYSTGLVDLGLQNESINSTSLSLYAGPELERFQGSDLSPPWPHPFIGRHLYYHGGIHHFLDFCSVLYTGDADLQPPANRQELKSFLTLPRWQRIALLQVPHHGSRNNWQIGSAREFSHHYSVFCADEFHQKFKHPHREVLLDLTNQNPVLANKTNGCSWHGRAYFH